MTLEIISNEYNEAVKFAANNPGTVVTFIGKLPSNHDAVQKIVRVPDGSKPHEFFEAVGGRPTVGMDQFLIVTGTHSWDGKEVPKGWHDAGYKRQRFG